MIPADPRYPSMPGMAPLALNQAAPASWGQPTVGRLAPDRSAMLWNVPMWVLAALTINHLGRPFEFVLSGFKIPFIICLIGIVAVFTSRALTGFLSRPGKPLLAFTVWMAVCCPLSIWKGGSTNYLMYFAGLQVVLFLLAASAPRSLEDIKRICYIILGAASFYILIGERATGGRLDLTGTFGNADDAALLAGFTLPFLVLVAQRIRNPIVSVVTLVIGVAWLLRIISMSGTRAGLLAMISMLAVYFIHGTAVQRISIVGFSALALVAMLAFLPAQILNRFASTFESFGSETVLEEKAQDEAYASAVERRELLRDAIKMTMHNPIFGVGPGEFPDYRYNYLDPGAKGGHKRFFPSHNTYLQVSSEEGIPGVLCYICFFGAAFLTLRRCIKLNRPAFGAAPDLAWNISVALQASFVYFVVCAAFMTCERHPEQYLVAGLAVAFERVSRLRAGKKTTLGRTLAGSQISAPVRMAPTAATPVLVGAGTPAAVSSSAPQSQAPDVYGPVQSKQSALRRPR